MRLSFDKIKLIIIAVVIICVGETAFMVKKNFAGSKSTEDSSEESSIDDISEDDINELLNKKLLIKPLEDDFKIISPAKTESKSGEDYVLFTGMSDPSGQLQLNGEDVDVYYTGNFVLKKKLEAGDNSFTFNLGDKNVTYKVNKVEGMIDYITPQNTLNVEKGMQAEVSVKIYSGAEAYMTLGSQKAELKEVENSNELYEKGTKYALYKGYIDTSAFNEGEDCGKVKIHASLDGSENVKDGPKVTINRRENKENIAVISQDSAFVYDSQNTSSVPLNDVYPLAKGTKDYITSKIVADKNVYYNLESGKRVKESDVKISPVENLDNVITGLEVSEDDNYAYIKVAEKTKVPYKFCSENEGFKDKKVQDYSVTNFKLSGVKIYFPYTKEAKNNISYTKNEFFNSVEFKDDEGSKYLDVKFAKSNLYQGHMAYYDGEGKLVFRFLKQKKSFKDLKILIEPGHGLIGDSQKDLGSFGFNDQNENSINLKIAKKLQQVLESEGASCVLLDTEKDAYPLSERGKQARLNDCDLYLSLHTDAAGYGDLNGVKTAYFTPYSEKTAENIQKQLVKCYEHELFSDKDDNFDKGTVFKSSTSILERENPAIYISLAYINNPEVFNKLIDENMELKIAKYIVKGIKESYK